MRDWSTQYDRDGSVAVEGNKQLFLSRFLGSGTPTTDSGSQSLVDVDVVAEEIDAHGQKRDLLRIPVYNKENEKGFLLFFVPPISAGQPRHIHTAFGVKSEFEKTLGTGHDDEVSFSVRQVAHNHLLKLKMVILQDVDLPSIGYEPQFGHDFVQTETQYDPNTKRSYKTMVCELGEAPVTGTAQYRVMLKTVARK